MSITDSMLSTKTRTETGRGDGNRETGNGKSRYEALLERYTAHTNGFRMPLTDWKFAYATNEDVFLRLPIELVDRDYKDPQGHVQAIQRVYQRAGATETVQIAISKTMLRAFYEGLPRIDVAEKLECMICVGSGHCAHCSGMCPNCGGKGWINGPVIGSETVEAFVMIGSANFTTDTIAALLDIADAMATETIFYVYSSPNEPNLFRIDQCEVVVFPHIFNTLKIDTLYKFNEKEDYVFDARESRGSDRQDEAEPVDVRTVGQD